MASEENELVATAKPLLRSMRAPPSEARPLSVLGFVLVALVKVPSAWHMASILFTAPEPPDFWCARPSALHHWDVRKWMNVSHPHRGEQSYDLCNVYDLEFEILKDPADVSVLHNTSTKACKDFEYNPDAPHTVVTQWDLVCGRQILVPVSQFFYLIGILIGGIVSHFLLMRICPRLVVIGGMVVQIVAGVGVALAPHFELQVALRFATAVACCCMFSAGYIICTDVTCDQRKLVLACCYEHFWSLGVITLPIVASLFNDWRYFQYAITLPTILLLLSYKFLPDSSSWQKDRQERCQLKVQTNGHVGKKKIDHSWFSMWKYSKLQCKVFALHIVWACTVTTYYGALLNVKNLGPNLFLNIGIAGFAEILGALLGLQLCLWCPIVWTVLGLILVIGGIACILCWLLASGNADGMLALGMIGRIAIACSLYVLTVFTAKLMPLHLRRITTFSYVTFARVILSTAPFIGLLAMFGEQVSLTAFGTLTLLGGISVLSMNCNSFQDIPHKNPEKNNSGIQVDLSNLKQSTHDVQHKEVDCSTIA